MQTSLFRVLFGLLLIIGFGLNVSELKAQDIEITDPTLQTPQEYVIGKIAVEGNEKCAVKA